MESDIREEDKEIKFLYKFKPGYSNQSKGIFVAKLAGINDKVLRMAEIKS